MWVAIIIMLCGYLSGSIPFGKLIARHYGIDIQKRGSGNIGFANVLRVIGWRAALPVIILDVAKGFIPTFGAYLLFGANVGFVVGICAILGHVFPIWLHFHGGKGISTGLGVLLGTTTIVGFVGFSVYVLSSLLLRNSARASITAGISVLISGVVIYPEYTYIYVTLIAIALWTLRKNLFGTVPNYDS